MPSLQCLCGVLAHVRLTAVYITRIYVDTCIHGMCAHIGYTSKDLTVRDEGGGNKICNQEPFRDIYLDSIFQRSSIREPSSSQNREIDVHVDDCIREYTYAGENIKHMFRRSEANLRNPVLDCTIQKPGGCGLMSEVSFLSPCEISLRARGLGEIKQGSFSRAETAIPAKRSLEALRSASERLGQKRDKREAVKSKDPANEK